MLLDFTTDPSIVVDKLASQLQSHGGYVPEKQALAFFTSACKASSVLRECVVNTPATPLLEIRGVTDALFALVKFDVSVSLTGDETPDRLAEMLGMSCGTLLDEHVRGKLPPDTSPSKAVVVGIWRSIVLTPYDESRSLRGVDARFQVKLRVAVVCAA